MRGDPQEDRFLIVLFEHLDSLQPEPGVLDESLGHFRMMMAEKHSRPQPFFRPVSLCRTKIGKESAAGSKPFRDAADKNSVFRFRQVRDRVEGQNRVKTFRREFHRSHVGLHESSSGNIAPGSRNLPT